MEFMGFIIADVQYHGGRISGRDLMNLVRISSKPNCIVVLNPRSERVGTIEQSAAQVLYPLMNSFLIDARGIIPKVPSRGSSSFKLQVLIYTRLQDFAEVEERLEDSGLKLYLRSELMGSESNEQDIIKLSHREILSGSLEPPKDLIQSTLLPHQNEGLHWLVTRENSYELPPFWEKEQGIYVNNLTNYRTDIRPEPIRGGIFCDEMGLGKTLTLLSLVALDKSSVYAVENGDGDNNQENENNTFLGKAPKMGSKKSVSSSTKKRKTSSSEQTTSLEPKTTLIVCPPSVVSVWLTQLDEHTRQGSFRMFKYNGEQRDAKELMNQDIVLTTYSTLGNEESDNTIKEIRWRRIILDEANLMRNLNAKTCHTINNLNAERRWAVTGTLQNNLDLFPIMAFLNIKPLSMENHWRKLIQRPLTRGDEQGVSRLQVLMSTISLRRTKDIVLAGFPSKSIETFYVTLREDERKAYDQMEEEAKIFIKPYILNESLLRDNYSTVLFILLRLRQICIDVARCPPSLLRDLVPQSQIEVVKNNQPLLQNVVTLLQDSEDCDCPICISHPTDIVITRCTHIFCSSCILKHLQTKPDCPICRHHLSPSDLFKALPEPSRTLGAEKSSSVSSKVENLIKLLTSSRDAKPSSKSVIFSQFREMLLMLEEPLKKSGFNVIQLGGVMTPALRANVIKEFNVPAPEGPTILLASVKALHVGINLTAASTVYVLEPWWNPAVEEQAIDCVHRIGQVENVSIVRLIVKNTIEERILQLQENKRALANTAVGRKLKKEINGDDLISLMSLGEDYAAAAGE